MQIRAEEISQVIREQIKDYAKKVEVSETGTVLSVGDGIARIHGVEMAMAGELLEFTDGTLGMVLNLEEDNVGVAVMGEVTHIKEGDAVKRTGRIADVPVGDAVLGRVIDPVGNPWTARAPSPPTSAAASRWWPPAWWPASRSTNPCTPASRPSTPWSRWAAASANW